MWSLEGKDKLVSCGFWYWSCNTKWVGLCFWCWFCRCWEWGLGWFVWRHPICISFCGRGWWGVCWRWWRGIESRRSLCQKPGSFSLFWTLGLAFVSLMIGVIFVFHWKERLSMRCWRCLIARCMVRIGRGNRLLLWGIFRELLSEINWDWGLLK